MRALKFLAGLGLAAVICVAVAYVAAFAIGLVRLYIAFS